LKLFQSKDYTRHQFSRHVNLRGQVVKIAGDRISKIISKAPPRYFQYFFSQENAPTSITKGQKCELIAEEELFMFLCFFANFAYSEYFAGKVSSGKKSILFFTTRYNPHVTSWRQIFFLSSGHPIYPIFFVVSLKLSAFTSIY